MNFPVFSQLAGKFGHRDGFAPDCLLSQPSLLNCGSLRRRGFGPERRAFPGGLRHVLRRDGRERLERGGSSGPRGRYISVRH
jgi:hypothetical protein